MSKTATEIMIEEAREISESLRLETELEEMDSRELLHRYANVSEYRGLYMYKMELDEVKKIEKERWMYESELLKRMKKKPNDFKPSLF